LRQQARPLGFDRGGPALRHDWRPRLSGPMVTLQFQPIGAPEKCLDRAIQISASSWRKTMNRRHSQSSYATPVKSLPMSDDANAAIGTSRKRCHPRAMSEIHRIVLQNSL
jgi:hypothetical protein